MRHKTLTINDCRDDIQFDRSYINNEYGTTTLYFNAPSDILNVGEFDSATSAKISVEFPSESPAYFYSVDGSVMFSPVFEPDNGLFWYDVDLPYEDIDILLTLFDKGMRFGNGEK